MYITCVLANRVRVTECPRTLSKPIARIVIFNEGGVATLFYLRFIWPFPFPFPTPEMEIPAARCWWTWLVQLNLQLSCSESIKPFLFPPEIVDEINSQLVTSTLLSCGLVSRRVLVIRRYCLFCSLEFSDHKNFDHLAGAPWTSFTLAVE